MRVGACIVPPSGECPHYVSGARVMWHSAWLFIVSDPTLSLFQASYVIIIIIVITDYDDAPMVSKQTKTLRGSESVHFIS